MFVLVRNYLLLCPVLLFSLSLTLTACTRPALTCVDELGCVNLGPNEPIRIARFLASSGPTAFLGIDSRGGIDLALADWDGELLGHAVEWVDYDSGCSREMGRQAAESVIADGSIIAIIGPNCTSAVEGALSFVSRAGLTMISPSATAAHLTEPDRALNGIWQPGYYRTAYNNDWQGQIAAEYAYYVHGARTAAILYDDSPYAESLRPDWLGGR